MLWWIVRNMLVQLDIHSRVVQENPPSVCRHVQAWSLPALVHWWRYGRDGVHRSWEQHSGSHVRTFLHTALHKFLKRLDFLQRGVSTIPRSNGWWCIRRWYRGGSCRWGGAGWGRAITSAVAFSLLLFFPPSVGSVKCKCSPSHAYPSSDSDSRSFLSDFLSSFPTFAYRIVWIHILSSTSVSLSFDFKA